MDKPILQGKETLYLTKYNNNRLLVLIVIMCVLMGLANKYSDPNLTMIIALTNIIAIRMFSRKYKIENDVELYVENGILEISRPNITDIDGKGYQDYLSTKLDDIDNIEITDDGEHLLLSITGQFNNIRYKGTKQAITDSTDKSIVESIIKNNNTVKPIYNNKVGYRELNIYLSGGVDIKPFIDKLRMNGMHIVESWEFN